MTRELGSYNTTGTRTHVRFQFSTHNAAGANVAPSSAFEAADLRIYRANDSAAYSATQRSSSNGVTMTSPFDSLTGVHDVDIDLADNSDAGFYAAGYRYSVVLAPDETVDSQTITGVVLAEFEIGPPPANATQINGDASAAAAQAKAADAVVEGTVTSGATTTSVPTSGMTPAAAATDQFKGRTLIFTRDTATAQLRGQATNVTANTSGGTLTVTALTVAPASGDTFILV